MDWVAVWIYWVLGAFICFVAIGVIRWFLIGHRLINRFERGCLDWIQADPRRTEQKDIFFQIMVAMGMSPASCRTLVMGAISEALSPAGKSFGRTLAGLIETNITFESTGSDAGLRAERKEAMRAMRSMQAKLVQLDD